MTTIVAHPGFVKAVIESDLSPVEKIAFTDAVFLLEDALKKGDAGSFRHPACLAARCIFASQWRVGTGIKRCAAPITLVARHTVAFARHVKKAFSIVIIAICTNFFWVLSCTLSFLEFVERNTRFKPLAFVSRFLLRKIIKVSNLFFGRGVLLLGCMESRFKGYNLAKKSRNFIISPFRVFQAFKRSKPTGNGIEHAGNGSEIKHNERLKNQTSSITSESGAVRQGGDA